MGSIGYQWRANGIDIVGATGSSFTPGLPEVGTTITVRASYIDGFGTSESVTSAATAAVTATNNAPSGTVTIVGTPTQGQTLSAVDTLSDADGLGALAYQWFADGAVIAGATGSTLLLQQAHVGNAISVTASYTDGGGTGENVTSAATAAVADTNDLPSGSVTIAGTPLQGQTLSASHTLADADGLGVIGFQWWADGLAIGGATGSTLLLGQGHVGKAISVTASYTDGGATAESVSSASTAAVVNLNDAPTGNVTIGGTPTQGQTLTAAHTLGDADGVGAVGYQWLADGVAIGGAIGSTLLLGQAEVGKVISVSANYTDGGGTLETVSSGATATVANAEDAPAGSVTIGGTPTQGQTLSATHTLSDADGLGAIGYQWFANGVAISGATGSTLLLGQSAVGKAISVTASYTDGGNTLEAVSSAATAPVANVNDAPTGGVTITGTPTQGQTLSAAHSLADADGLGSIGYQWRADGIAIAGATGSTLVLGQAQVGKVITVAASYTDGGGHRRGGEQRGHGGRGQRQRRAERQRHDRRHVHARTNAERGAHAGRRRWPGHGRLPMARRRHRDRRRHRQHAGAGPGAGRQGHHGHGQLRRWRRHRRNHHQRRDRRRRRRQRRTGTEAAAGRSVGHAGRAVHLHAARRRVRRRGRGRHAELLGHAGLRRGAAALAAIRRRDAHVERHAGQRRCRHDHPAHRRDGQPRGHGQRRRGARGGQRQRCTGVARGGGGPSRGARLEGALRAAARDLRRPRCRRRVDVSGDAWPTARRCPAGSSSTLRSRSLSPSPARSNPHRAGARRGHRSIRRNGAALFAFVVVAPPAEPPAPVCARSDRTRTGARR